MHVHNQPVNLYATNIQSSATVGSQQAAKIRSRLAKAASNLSDESDPFESFMVGQAPDETSRRQRSHGRSSVAKALVAEENSRPEPSIFMPEPHQLASTPTSGVDDLHLRVRGYVAQGVS